MKKLFLTVVSLFILAAANAQDSTALSKGIMQALQSGDIEDLKKLVASPEVYKALYAEAKTLTDEQIKEKTSGNEKLKSDFESLLGKAKEKKIDLKQLHYDSLHTENPWGSDEAPWAMSIYMSINNKTVELAVSALRYNGNWYFMEFLTTTNVFKEF
ncbi:MAG: hypothetical protein F9K23_07955 [Bacteroidetes bacterium]|nr:MAG: hypothetical protein F9K23_07955 [Bacteroidota bacterium]